MTKEGEKNKRPGRTEMAQAGIKLDDFFQRVETEAEFTSDDIFTIETNIEGEEVKALVSCDDPHDDLYSKSVIFWPINNDGELSSRILKIWHGHLNNDGDYTERVTDAALQFVEVPKSAPFKPNGEIDNSTLNTILNVELFPDSYPKMHIGPYVAAKFIGDVKLESLKPV